MIRTLFNWFEPNSTSNTLIQVLYNHSWTLDQQIQIFECTKNIPFDTKSGRNKPISSDWSSKIWVSELVFDCVHEVFYPGLFKDQSRSLFYPAICFDCCYGGCDIVVISVHFVMDLIATASLKKTAGVGGYGLFQWTAGVKDQSMATPFLVFLFSFFSFAIAELFLVCWCINGWRIEREERVNVG